MDPEMLHIRRGPVETVVVVMAIALSGLAGAQPFPRIIRLDGPVDIDSEHHCRITSVSLDDDTRNQRLWQIKLPPRMANVVRDVCEFGRVSSRLPWRGDVATLHVGELLVIADQTGFLLADYNAGKVLAERATEHTPSAVFSQATFTIEGTGLTTCKGRAGEVVLRRCGDRVVYFNGTSAALIDIKAMKVEAEGRWTPPVKAPAPVNGKRTVDGIVSVGRARLSFVGTPRG
jgi:hypothetical protein